MLGLPSCKDFLDAAPDTRVELVTVQQLRELLVTGYMSYNYAIVGELSSDNVIDNNSPNEDGQRYNLSAYDLGDEEFHLAFRTDDFEAAHKLHEEMGCICFENHERGIYFIQDPDGYWLEILPTRR